MLLGGIGEEERLEGNRSALIKTSVFHRRHFIHFFLIPYIHLVKKGPESFLFQAVEDFSFLR